MQRSPVRWSPPLRRALGAVSLALLVPALAFAQANGKLQIHHMKIGQGDGMLLISPLGQTALFDDGVYTNCTYIKSYIQGLGISVVDYHFASHYHADHIGCIDDLAAIDITIGTAGYDRGSTYSSATFTNYVNTLGGLRTTIAKNQTITLDAGAANPVLIKCVDLNGAGVYSPSGSDENAKSVVLKVSYGAFDEVIGGDLTGDGSTDVETTVGPEVGDVEVYKVHHHGSAFSTNDSWLDATTPEVGIIQVGNGNSYGHPTVAALGRLHAHGVKTYWTETGAGANPDPTWDTVANETIVVQADPGTSEGYTVSGPGFSDSYNNGGGGGPPPTLTETLVASAMTMIKGSITVGDVTRLAADDAVRVSISAGVDGGKYLTDWYGSVTLNHPPTALTITYDGNYTVSRTQTLYLWNWGTSAWVQVDQASVSTSDVTRTWSTTSPSAYVSASLEVRLRVASNKRNNSFTCRGDYMAFTYDYLQGTAPAMVASLPREEGDPPDLGRAGTPELPLSVLTRVAAMPSAEGVSLVWAVDIGAHVDGFNVYREDAAGGRVFAGNETMLGLGGDEAEFRFVDGSAPGSAATYWLGARTCSGAEAMIGPIRVGAAALDAPRVAFAASPSLVRDGTRFAFAVPHRSEVELDVFDVTGRRVATVFRGTLEPGPASFDWNRATDSGEAAAPGIYFARLQGFGRTQLTRLTLLAE
jgi:beta-lactamase superfamily II metal-dependent hydrolase